MGSNRWLALAFHYLAMFVLVWLVVGIVRRVAGDTWIGLEFLALGAACLAYILLVLRLGIAPESWERPLDSLQTETGRPATDDSDVDRDEQQ